MEEDLNFKMQLMEKELTEVISLLINSELMHLILK